MITEGEHRDSKDDWRGSPPGGEHFHVSSHTDVQQVSVRFLALKRVSFQPKNLKGCHFQAIKV